MQTAAFVILAGCLIYVSVDDLRSFQIRNEVVAMLLAVSIVQIVLVGEGTAEMLARLVFATLMFGVFVGAYAIGMMGGGDTKLLGVALLWIGPKWAVPFAALLLLGAALAAGLVWVGLIPSRGVGRRRTIPFGPVIAIAWLVTAALST